MTFDDAASEGLPDGTNISSGTYKPSVGTAGSFSGCPAPLSFPDPAPAGPYGSTLSVFNGTNPNGTWKLYVIDDSANEAGTISGWSLTISASTPDTKSPRVVSTVPTDGAKGVGPSANIKATFSEEMLASSILFGGKGGAFEHFKKGPITKVGATVSYNPNLDRAVLNPNNSLKSGTTYKAVVTTGARDEADNRLDQSSPRRARACTTSPSPHRTSARPLGGQSARTA